MNERRAMIVIATGVLWLWLSPCAVAELIPVPEFSSHEIPTTKVAAADGSWWEYLDVAALLLALSLATYFALVTRSRRNLFLLTIACLLWFGFWRKGCVCSIGATQNVALAIFDATYVVPVSVVAFFVLPLLFTLFFGRTFCASVCPLGAIQEVVAVRSVTVPKWLDHSLGIVAYIYLGAAVIFAATGTAFVICRYDPFVGFFRLGGNVNMVVFGACLLAIGIFVGRPYCRYLCPYGAVLRVLSKFSKWHVQIPPVECVNCRLCEDVCPYGAIQPPTVAQATDQRQRGRRRLVVYLLLTPILIVFFAWVGTLLKVPLSRVDPEVRLAEQLRLEDTGATDTVTDASEAFRTSRHSQSELYALAITRRERFEWLGGALGGWVGLVVGIKLISLAMRRRRDDFSTEHSGCVSCGRCFWYCPGEQVRLGLIEDIPGVTQAT